MRSVWFTLLAGSAFTGGCVPDRATLLRRLESRDPADRITAIVKLADLEAGAGAASPSGARTSLIPRLIDRLDDEDEGVRFYAILALERLTGTRLGYDYSGHPSRRREAIQRWRASEAAAGQPTGEGVGGSG